jgi:hypothetical protein
LYLTIGNDESGGVSSSDGPESDISMINIDNNYETESTETRKESTDEEITEKTYGRGRGCGRGVQRLNHHM